MRQTATQLVLINHCHRVDYMNEHPWEVAHLLSLVQAAIQAMKLAVRPYPPYRLFVGEMLRVNNPIHMVNRAGFTPFTNARVMPMLVATATTGNPQQIMQLTKHCQFVTPNPYEPHPARIAEFSIA